MTLNSQSVGNPADNGPGGTVDLAVAGNAHGAVSLRAVAS